MTGKEIRLGQLWNDNRYYHIELIYSSNVPIQDRWRGFRHGHRLWNIREFTHEFSRRRKRRGLLERIHDKIMYKWFKGMDCWWPELKRAVKSFRYWFKVIHQDRDWDQAYLAIIMEHKLRKILAYRLDPKSNYMAHVGEEKTNKAILEMAVLLGRMREFDYISYGCEVCEEQPSDKWHMPFRDLRVSPFKSSTDYENHMREQDMDRFCHLFKKYYDRLWD